SAKTPEGAGSGPWQESCARAPGVSVEHSESGNGRIERDQERSVGNETRGHQEGRVRGAHYFESACCRSLRPERFGTVRSARALESPSSSRPPLALDSEPRRAASGAELRGAGLGTDRMSQERDGNNFQPASRGFRN